MPGKDWTEDEKDLLRALYPTMAACDLSTLMNRTEDSVKHMAKTMKVRSVTRRPPVVRPIGSERMEQGYLLRKVANTGQRTDWKRVDVMEWEALNGPVPEGCLLMLKDATLPRTLDNLQLFTRKEHFDRISLHMTTPEMAELYRLKGQITQAIKRMEKAKA